MADVKWIKIVTDIFEDEKILLIENMPDADSLLVIWFKMLCLAGKQNNGGVLKMNEKLAYTDKMLATIFRRPVETVGQALQIFLSFGMIAIDDDCFIISNWGRHQNIEGLEKIREQTRRRTANYREKKKQNLPSCDGDVTVTRRDATDKNREDENIIDNINISDKPEKIIMGQYNNVVFTNEEFLKLKSEFSDYKQQIENLSDYIASTGRNYKNHLATICSWDKKNNLRKSKTYKTENNISAYDIELIEKTIVNKHSDL
ncbi:MAG: phage replisome organizer N-terminal domain-containing protein [Oscillospiraceae bacterium]|nr:phage replisome organizer N-terminal domain-containing protein [Oscillospiraceae bacterium]